MNIHTYIKNKLTNEQKTIKKTKNKQTKKTKTNEQTNKQTNEQTNKQTNEQTNKQDGLLMKQLFVSTRVVTVKCITHVSPRDLSDNMVGGGERERKDWVDLG